MTARWARVLATLGPAALASSLCACDSSGNSGSSPVAFVSAEPVNYDYALPDFQMVDQQGNKVTRADLTGKVLVVDFFFTTCPTICPRLTTRMAVLGKELTSDTEVRLVSITVDPENDTPEKLAAYRAKYGAKPDQWVFLTGEPDHVRDTVLKGFKMAVRRVSDANIDHAEKFVLVDKQMHVRGVFDTDDASLAALAKQARELAAIKAR
ncbi:MAG: SCO family protein [Myxococcales bacterium]|nr:SCO family protein [Myxococcales bacterium]